MQNAVGDPWDGGWCRRAAGNQFSREIRSKFE